MREPTKDKSKSPMVEAEIELVHQLDQLAKSYTREVSKYLTVQIQQLDERDEISDDEFAERVRDLLGQKWIDLSLIEEAVGFAQSKLEQWEVAEYAPLAYDARSSILVTLYKTCLAILTSTLNKSVDDRIVPDRSLRIRRIKSVLKDFK